jgi:hypothetical protein
MLLGVENTSRITDAYLTNSRVLFQSIAISKPHQSQTVRFPFGRAASLRYGNSLFFVPGSRSWEPRIQVRDRNQRGTKKRNTL